MRTLSVAVVTLALAACTNEVTGTNGQGGGGTAAPVETGCADITGNYDVTATRQSGTCPEGESATSKATLTIAKNGDALSIFLPGISGGCDGALDTDSCRFQAQCIVTSNGQQAITYNVDYTFSGKTFAGSLVAAAEAGVLDEKPCTANVKHEGTRL